LSAVTKRIAEHQIRMKHQPELNSARASIDT